MQFLLCRGDIFQMSDYYGAHVSCAGGFEKAIENANTLGVNTIQVHPSPPQRWNRNPYAEGYEEKFLKAKEASCVEKVFFHAIYLINLATPDPEKLELAKKSLTHYLQLSSKIQGEGVIVHVGSLKDEPDEERGLKRAADTINTILAQTPEDSYLILEVAAGSGKIIGANFSQLRFIYDRVEQNERLGFGLDTQHMWASGYDLQNKLDETIIELGESFEYENIWCVHLNDSKTELASRKDRHENLGKGLIGEKALKEFIKRPELEGIPVVLETPALKDLGTAKDEVELLKSWV